MTARTTLAATAAVRIATAALTLGLLAGCAADNPGLDTLRSDPIATAEVPGLTETQLFGQVEFTALGKREPATLTRLFRTGTAAVTADDLARAANEADADGWQLTPAPKHTWTGTKTIDGSPVAISIRRNFSLADRELVAVVLTEQ